MAATPERFRNQYDYLELSQNKALLKYLPTASDFEPMIAFSAVCEKRKVRAFPSACLHCVDTHQYKCIFEAHLYDLPWLTSFYTCLVLFALRFMTIHTPSFYIHQTGMFGYSQSRHIVVTAKALYNFRPQDEYQSAQRVIPIARIAGLVQSTFAPKLVIQVCACFCVACLLYFELVSYSMCIATHVFHVFIVIYQFHTSNKHLLGSRIFQRNYLAQN